MKALINSIVDKISVINDPSRVNQRLKQSSEIEIMEERIYELTKEIESKKNRWRNSYGRLGNKPMSGKKHPIVFFGEILTQKDNEYNSAEERVNRLEVDFGIFREKSQN